MASKLMLIAAHEAENQTELSLRQAFELLRPKLKPPFSLAISSPEEYLELNRAILYGVLCEPHLAKTHIKHLHGIVTDGYSFFVDLLVKVVCELHVKLFDSVKSQLIWVCKEMIDVCAVGFDVLLVCLLRQIVGGDFSDGNLWLCFEVLNIFLDKWDSLLQAEPMVLTSALYTYLRLLADHCRSIDIPKLEPLKQLEIEFCVRVLKEQFHLCLKIGRDLIRVLQELVHVPEFRAIWKNLILNPSVFKTPEFTGISQLCCTRTPSSYFLLRITPVMEAQLRFLLTHVKLGSQKRHQAWFTKKFLCDPERETLISDIVRFVCCGHYPPNEIIQSEVIPRWAVIGWLLKSCTKNYAEANVKLALFYDWLFFDNKIDNIMNIEPAILLIINSIPRYINVTHTLLDFLFLLVDNYDEERKDLIVKGITSSLRILVQRGVIQSWDVLISCGILSPFLKERLMSFLSGREVEILKDLDSSNHPHQLSTLLELQSSPDTQTQRESLKRKHIFTGDVGSSCNLVVASVLVSDNSAGACNPLQVTTDGPVDTLQTLIQKFEQAFRTPDRMCLKTFEESLSSVMILDNQGPNNSSTLLEVVSSKLSKICELNGYKLFPHLKSLHGNFDYVVEIGSPTAIIIRLFIFSQHQRLQEMLLFWARSGLQVGAWLLAYASRLAYEEGMANCTVDDMVANEPGKGLDLNLRLLLFHADGFRNFVDARVEDSLETFSSICTTDKTSISKLVNGAFAAYRCFLVKLISSVSNETAASLPKLICSDLISCSGWGRKMLKNFFSSVFSYLPDLSVGEEELIRLLVDQLDHRDLLEMQFGTILKKFSIFGKSTETISKIIRSSLTWDCLMQHKLWGLIGSEFGVSKVQLEKIVTSFFCTGKLDENASAIAVGGLLTLLSSSAPTPELVGAVLSLPNSAFQNFAASVLATWAASDTQTLYNSMAEFSEKLSSNAQDISDRNEIMINHSAVLWLLDYFSAQGLNNADILSNFRGTLRSTKSRQQL